MIDPSFPIKTDLHCHTVASTHAYSTVLELAEYAAKAGLEAIAVTDHGPALPDGAHLWHFGNQRCFPETIRGVRVLRGAEANILNFEGEIDIPSNVCARLDWVVASFHNPVAAPGTVEQNTSAYLKLADNPDVDVIGHSGTEDYRYDYERVLPVFREKHKLVEINSHSFEARPGAPENCREIALLCKKYRVPVTVDSDAHIAFDVGSLGNAVSMLRSIDFPEELVVNRSLSSLAAWLRENRGREILKP